MAGIKEGPMTMRQRLFLCRKRIDKSPSLLAAVEVALGTVVFAHVFIAAAMLGGEVRQISKALLPIGAFCFEVAALSLAVLVFVIKDLCIQPEESISVWQREAFGRLLRNIVLGCLLGLSFMWMYGSEGPALSGAVAPALVACSLGAAKVVLIRTERTWFWLGVSVLVTLQLFLLVMKTDHSLQLSWLWVCCPIYVLSIDVLFLIFTLISEDISQAKSSLFSIILIGTIKSLACVMVLVTTSLCALHAETAGAGASTVATSAAVTLCLSYVSGVRLSGAYLLNIIWGHVDVDFLHQRYPALLTRRQTV